MPDTPTNGRAHDPARSLVLVAGSGRSGTSLLTGVMQRLGYAVPQPEVPADDTNPRGFAESQWVVDFHTKLLRRTGVQVSDARPGAWGLTASAALDAEVAGNLRAWLSEKLAASDHVIVKDPRISWFLPLWRRCAEDLGVAPRFVTMLRHPAAVIASKQRWYGGWQGEVSRAAGWINQQLFTERATRDAPRVFIRYEDLLEDWTVAIGRAGEELDLDVVRRANPVAMRRVHEFVDRGLSRSQPDWEGLTLPGRLRDLADEVWTLACRLADGPQDGQEEVRERLDELRAVYTDLYAEAEAVAHSSIAASRVRTSVPVAPAGRPPAPAAWLIRRIPRQHRRRVPHSVRRVVIRTLSRTPIRAGR